MNNHLYVLSDGTQGMVSLFDGMYLAIFNDDTFDSPYTRVEDIAIGEQETIPKANQPVWIEHSSPNKAVDDSGSTYFHLLL